MIVFLTNKQRCYESSDYVRGEAPKLLLDEVMCFHFSVGSYRVISGINLHEKHSAQFMIYGLL
jgi:hypothetical protein